MTSIYKKGDATMASNYRGLSVLPTLPKLLAHTLLARLEEFSEQHELRAPTQAGFR